MLNNYNIILEKYNKVHVKPDKKFSMVPTILSLAKPIKNKIVVDVGCGDGFYTFIFSKDAKKVFGIDNSKEQIELAKNSKQTNVEFILGDMSKMDFPKSDMINAPYVLGYLKTKKDLIILFTKFYKSLNPSGKVIGLIDAPKSLIHNNQKFGSIKRVKGNELREGENIEINLYDSNKKIVTLHAYYHTKEIIYDSLRQAGFSKIMWHKPIISRQGIDKYGKKFWEEYLENCDIAYFTAKK
jgi:toxoflavin synthase